MDNTVNNLLSNWSIFRDVNTRNISGVLLREKNFTNLLGEIEYNETGESQ